MKEIGCLWVNKTAEGKVYLSGEVEVVVGLKTKVVGFKVEAKEGKELKKGSPNYRLFLSEDKREEPVVVAKPKVSKEDIL